MRAMAVLGAVGAVSMFAIGCSNSSSKSYEPIGLVSASLQRPHDCHELETMLKADALQKMNAQVDAQEQMIERYYDNGWGYGFAAPGAADNAGAGGTTAAGGGDKATSHSDTNVQVAGVDEADIVKTDGKYIYLLHGQSFLVLGAWPASSLGQTSSVAIEGEPIEMFVSGDQAVVYSTVDGTNVYKAAGLTPRGYYYDYGWYGPYAMGGGAAGADMACSPYGGPYGGGCYGWYQNPLTKVTVLSLGGGTNPQVVRESYFEGSYTSSRRMDTKVRTVLGGAAHGPQLKYWPDTNPNTKEGLLAAYENLRAQNAATINATTYADWLPYAMTKENGNVVARMTACQDMYVPTQGSTNYGMTTIASFDLASLADAPKQTAIIGAIDTVYANEDTMVLAARAWVDPWWEMVGYAPVANAGAGTVGSGGASAGNTGSAPAQTTKGQSVSMFSAPNVVTTTFTQLHAFDLKTDPTNPTYVASATLAGYIKDQFSIDAQGPVVRVATTETRMSVDPNVQITRELASTNHVFALSPRGNQLAVVGDAGDIAPGESIYSTRFVNDRAYVVTYRQVDPLFVVDLSNPSSLRVVGAVTIPGFSNYMQPIDAGHLLTIGQDVTANEPSGLALQIFDVTNPTSPQLTSKFVFSGNQYGYSTAQYDHKAFTYFADKGLLTFPFYAYDQSNGGMRSSAELFKVDVNAGIARLGSVDHTALFGTSYQGYCGGYFAPWVRRGVFLDNVLYSISYGGVVATDSTTMGSLSTLKLAAPSLPGYPGCAQ